MCSWLLKDGKIYTSEIIRALHSAELIVVEGTLYPLLNRLAKDGLLAYEWQESEQGPPRKYYWLTDDGKALLGESAEGVSHAARLDKHAGKGAYIMNEVSKIHLGRQAFAISADAHRSLRNYLDAIKRRVHDDDVVKRSGATHGTSYWPNGALPAKR